MISHRFQKEYSSQLSLIAHFNDALAIVLSGWVAFLVPDWPQSLDEQRYQVAIIIGTLIAIIVFPRYGIYQSWRGKGWLTQIRSVLLAWITVMSILVFFAFLTKTGALYSRHWLMLWGFLGLMFLALFRIAFGVGLRLMRLKGWNHKRLIIIGAGELGRSVAKKLSEALASGLNVCAFLDDNELLRDKKIERVTVEGDISKLLETIEKYDADEVWVALPLRAEKRLRYILHDLRHSTVAIRFVPDIFNFSLINHSVSDIAGLPVLNLSESPIHGVNWAKKNLEDKLIGLMILILVSPIMLIFAIGIKISSPGPIFYKQERVSWNGKPFTMLKFRTMPVDVEKDSGPVWANKKEARATRFGEFLRKTSLDELPQFFNVLKGDMSIVGPRPERPYFVEKFKEEIPDYMKKHLVKGGITGWAQVNGWRGNTSLDKRIEYDLYYVQNWSLGFDLKIIILTIFKGFIHRNAY